MVVGEVILVGIEIEDAAGITPERHRLLLVVLDLAPCLDDILLLVSHIVERHLVGILVIGKMNDGLRSSIDSFLLRAFII